MGNKIKYLTLDQQLEKFLKERFYDPRSVVQEILSGKKIMKSLEDKKAIYSIFDEVDTLAEKVCDPFIHNL